MLELAFIASGINLLALPHGVTGSHSWLSAIISDVKRPASGTCYKTPCVWLQKKGGSGARGFNEGPHVTRFLWCLGQARSPVHEVFKTSWLCRKGREVMSWA